MSRQGKLFSIIGVLLLVLALGFPFITAFSTYQIEGSTAELISLKVGDARFYRFVGEYHVTLEDLFLGNTQPSSSSLPGVIKAAVINPSTASTQRTTVSGTLAMKVFDSRGGKATIGMQLMEARCPDEVSINPRCHEVYGSPMLLSMESTGMISFLDFSHQLSLSEERKLRGLIEPLSLALSAGERWQSHGSDSQGEAVFQYSRGGDWSEVSRQKLDYLAIRSEGGFIDSGEVVESQAHFNLAKNGSWLETALIRERLLLKSKGMKRMAFSTQVELKALSATPLNLGWTELTLANFRKGLNGGEKRITSRMQEERAKTTAALLKGDARGYQKKVVELSADLSPSEIVGKTGELTEWLRANPEFVQKIPITVSRAELSDDARSRLVYVLQKLATEQAQAALLLISQDPVQTESTRRAALGSFAFIPISSDTEEVLWDIRSGVRGEDRKVFREMATLALGGSAKALSGKDIPRAEGITNRLIDELQGSTQRKDIRDVETLLLSLGNSGVAEAMPVFEQYLTAGNDSVRRAVGTALQSFEKEPNLEKIADAMMLEESASVREELAVLLLQHRVTEYTFGAAAQLFIEEDDSSTRLLLARYLAKAVEVFPQHRGHIKSLVRSEQDPMIAQVLGTRLNPELR